MFGTYDLTMPSNLRIVFLVAPNGSELSEKLGSRKHGANRLLSVRGLCCVRLIVWVLFVNSIVCLFVFYACFLFLSVFGWDCWLALFGWLVFLGFNVFVFVRRV